MRRISSALARRESKGRESVITFLSLTKEDPLGKERGRGKGGARSAFWIDVNKRGNVARSHFQRKRGQGLERKKKRYAAGRDHSLVSDRVMREAAGRRKLGKGRKLGTILLSRGETTSPPTTPSAKALGGGKGGAKALPFLFILKKGGVGR